MNNEVASSSRHWNSSSSSASSTSPPSLWLWLWRLPYFMVAEILQWHRSGKIWCQRLVPLAPQIWHRPTSCHDQSDGGQGRQRLPGKNAMGPKAFGSATLVPHSSWTRPHTHTGQEDEIWTWLHRGLVGLGLHGRDTKGRGFHSQRRR